jgi:hypothetical protein
LVALDGLSDLFTVEEFVVEGEHLEHGLGSSSLREFFLDEVSELSLDVRCAFLVVLFSLLPFLGSLSSDIE